MKIFLIAVISGCVSLVLSAQTQKAPDLSGTGKPNSAIEHKAESLAKEALLDASNLESDENQIVVLTLATQIFWDRDEKYARKLATDAAVKLRRVLAPELSTNADVRSYMVYSPLRFGRLRRDFLVMVARNDVLFAQELKALTRPEVLTITPLGSSEQNTYRNWSENERGLEQKIAFQAAARNIGEALKIARDSLSLGISQEAINVLRRFHLKDSDAANSFVNELIQKLNAANFASDKEASELAAMLLFQLDDRYGAFRIPPDCKCPTKRLIVDPARRLRLANNWLDFALLQGDEKISREFLRLHQILPELLPARSIAITAKFNAIRKLQPEQVDRTVRREQVRGGKMTPEAYASLAVKLPDGERFQLYREAFAEAANTSKAALEKLRASIDSHPDGEDKSWLLDEIASNLAGKTADDGDLAAARNMAQLVNRRDRRLGLLSFIASEYLEKGQSAAAREISDEIAVLMDLRSKDKMPKSIVGYTIFPGMFRMFAMTNPQHAFNLLEWHLPDFDEHLSKPFTMSNTDVKISLQSIMQNYEHYAVSQAKPIAILAEADFDRMKNLTANFTKPELVVLTKLLLAQAVLQGKLGFRDVGDRREMLYHNN